jgi:hypothetical protein
MKFKLKYLFRKKGKVKMKKNVLLVHTQAPAHALALAALTASANLTESATVVSKPWLRNYLLKFYPPITKHFNTCVMVA